MNFLTKHLHKLSVKIFLIIFVGMILPISVLLPRAIAKYEAYIRGELSSRTISQLQKSEDEVYVIFQRMVNIASVICNDQELQQALEDESQDRYTTTLVFDKTVNTIEINNLYDMTDIKITCFDNRGEVYANWGTNYNDYRFLYQQDWVQDSIQANGHVRWNLFSPSYILEESSQVNYISLAKSMRSQSDGQTLATVIVSLKQDFLSQSLRQFFCEPDDAIYICTEGGSIVLSLDDNATFSDEQIRSWAEDFSDCANGSGVVSAEGREYLACYYTLSRQFTFNKEVLKVLHLTRYDRITQEMDQMNAHVNTVLILCVVSLLVVAVLCAKIITRPLEVLSEKMRNYQLEEELTGLDFQRRDEIGHLNRSFREMSETIRNLFEKQRQETEERERFRFESLRAQVNPHFLFNTLNTIRWLAIIRKADNIVACIDALATMMKYSMGRGSEYVTVKEEIENINSYMYISNCRYGNQFTFETDVSEEIQQLKVVKFILQPIVENALIHGFKGSNKQGRILLYGDVEGDVLKLYVEDNGTGLSREAVERLSQPRSDRKVTSIGIPNVDARIKSAYGQQFGVTVYNGAAGGTVAEYTLPVLREEEENAQDSDCGR